MAMDAKSCSYRTHKQIVLGSGKALTNNLPNMSEFRGNTGHVDFEPTVVTRLITGKNRMG